MNAPIIFTDLADTPYVEYKTTVNKRNIYVYNEFPDEDLSSPPIPQCKYYFYADTIYISLIIQGVLYIINTNNTGFTEELKTIIVDGIVQKNQTVKFKTNPGISYIDLSYLLCTEPRDLTNAKDAVARLNVLLNCIDYDVFIGYIFDMQNYVDVSVYHNNLLGLSRPLLYISHKNMCVSSLELSFGSNDEDITIDSKTSPEFENKKMNKLLRTILVLIAKTISPNIEYVESFAIHPSSVHLMVNVLNATAYYTDEDVKYEIPKNKLNVYANIDDIIEKHDLLTLRIRLTEENINNAQRVFNTMVDSFCTKMNGGKRKTRNRKKRIQRRKTRRVY